MYSTLVISLAKRVSLDFTAPVSLKVEVDGIRILSCLVGI